MDKLDFPNASEFTPNVINLPDVLDICNKNLDNSIDFLQDLKKTYFLTKAKDSQDQLTNNCRSALVAYGILKKGEIKFTDFGETLFSLRADSSTLYAAFAKHILMNLNGLILINTIQDMKKTGVKISNESVIKELNSLGADMALSSKKINTMKTWLAKAGVFVGKSWQIDSNVLERLVGVKEVELECFRNLTYVQRCFIKALNNTGVTSGQIAEDIKKLAMATYRIDYPTKNFSSEILRPLEDMKLISILKATKGRGAKSPTIEPTKKMLAEVTIPYLDQLAKVTRPELMKYFKFKFTDILKKVNSTDKHVKGLALEALAYKLMKLIDLDFMETRLRSEDTGGAEVDLLFESTNLIYSRWQIQCKNSKMVSLEDVAKEVGLTHLLHSNAIVMVGMGMIGDNARMYADKIMRESNLCIIMVDGKDLKRIAANPPEIIEVFNRESQRTKNIKVLDR